MEGRRMGLVCKRLYSKESVPENVEDYAKKFGIVVIIEDPLIAI
jgi:hypothetical protein